MQTFDQSLFQLYKEGRVTFLQAMANATNRHDFRLSLEKAGLVAVAGIE
jgi:Tfp pilus assembly ATPase PilU